METRSQSLLRPSLRSLPAHVTATIEEEVQRARRGSCAERATAIRPALWKVLHVRSSKYGHLTSYWPSRVVEFVVCTVVLVNVLLGATYAQLVHLAEERNATPLSLALFKAHEYFWWASAIFFLLEYLARWWSCVEEHEAWRVVTVVVEQHLQAEAEDGGSARGNRMASPIDDVDAVASPAQRRLATAATSASPPCCCYCARRLRWMIKPLSLFDLACVVMFYLPLAFDALPQFHDMSRDERNFFEEVSWFRLLLLLRLERQLKAMKRVIQVMRQSQVELLSSSFFTLVNILYISVLFYFAERHNKHDHSGNPGIHSLLDALYWCVRDRDGRALAAPLPLPPFPRAHARLACASSRALTRCSVRLASSPLYRTCETITTLGYGDIPPVTAGGKVIACFTCMMGMFSFAIPAGVISASFIEVIYKEREKNRAEREAIDFLNYAKLAAEYDDGAYDELGMMHERGDGDGDGGGDEFGDDYGADRSVASAAAAGRVADGGADAYVPPSSRAEHAPLGGTSRANSSSSHAAAGELSLHDISMSLRGGPSSGGIGAATPLVAAQHRLTAGMLAKMAHMLRLSEERNDARMQQLYALVAESMTGQSGAVPPPLGELEAKWERATGRTMSTSKRRTGGRHISS